MKFPCDIRSWISGLALLGCLSAASLGGCSGPQTGAAAAVDGSAGLPPSGGHGGSAGAFGKGGAGGGAPARGDASADSSDGSHSTGGITGAGGADSGSSGGGAGGSFVGLGGVTGSGGSIETGGRKGTGGYLAGGSAGGTGGFVGQGGAAGTVRTGGAVGSGGRISTGGAAGKGGAVGSGGSSLPGTGGTVGTGGSGTGGTVGTGGSGTGGTVGTGGSGTGGSGTGGSGTGGSGTGGSGTGGSGTGGSGTGGSGTGGSGTGGSGTGGSGTGGSGGQGGGTVSPGDGCTSELAKNLTLSQVAVYQSVKIPVMNAGAEVALAARNAHVVQGRDTMFRMFVTPGSGWTARELSARLTLTTGGTSAVYYSKKTISTASTDASQADSFQIYVPASAMAAPTRYSVEVVECTQQSGSAGAAKFPASGDIDLGVKAPGGLKITIIPLRYGSFVPDTSPSALAVYASQVAAMYPANTVTLTVGTTLNAAVDSGGAPEWETMLYQVMEQRLTDKPAANVYYYGLIKPADTLKAYCGTHCVTGLGFVAELTGWRGDADYRVAVGVGFADEDSGLTMAHEVGHNHGRDHAPCGVSSSYDVNYPYAGGSAGSWGYDARDKALFDPAEYKDLMGYCSPKWMSDYTYNAITTRMANVNEVSLQVYAEPGARSSWRQLRLGGVRGARWGTSMVNALLSGLPEQATIQDATGNSIATVTVYRVRASDLNAAVVLVPEPQPGWFAVTVVGAPSIPFDR